MNNNYLINKLKSKLITEYSKNKVITILPNSILGIPRKRSKKWLSIENSQTERS